MIKVREWRGELPKISLIVPVYNSVATLFNCLRSVAESDYPSEKIQIIIANNQSTDKSIDEYRRARHTFSQLRMMWINTRKGKARALNSAIVDAEGKYIVHIDSDGILERGALRNIIRNFEVDPTVDSLTGTVLTNFRQITKTSFGWLRLLRENEYLEYVQSFLAGRAVESERNQLFTMSGAFSAFRREKLMKTNLYNVETVGEDIDMTFQIRYLLKGRAALCPEAIFYVEPIEGLGELYTQRQRWQRGELETLHSFVAQRIGLSHFFSNFIVRRLMLDHTILLMRVIWMISVFFLVPMGYSVLMVVGSTLLVYLLYLALSAVNFINVQAYLSNFPADRSYYLHRWPQLITLPGYYMICSIIQAIGVINAMTASAQWKVHTAGNEWQMAKLVLLRDLRKLSTLKKKKPDLK